MRTIKQTLAAPRMYRLNPISGGEEAWIALGIIAAVGIGGYAIYKAKQTSAETSGNLVILQPGATTVAPKAGSTLTLQLPSGAKWGSITLLSGDSVTQPSGSASWVSPAISGSDTVTALWTNASGSPQTTSIVVVPS